MVTNTWGKNPDAFINDANEWEDYEGDGLGDNDADKCYDVENGELKDCTLDTDNDGYDDDDDQFPNEKTQWIDDDQDGRGDNCRFVDLGPNTYNAVNGDCSLNDRDNDGRVDPSNPVYTDANQIQIVKSSLLCQTIGTFERCEDAFPDDANEWWDNDEGGIL